MREPKTFMSMKEFAFLQEQIKLRLRELSLGAAPDQKAASNYAKGAERNLAAFKEAAVDGATVVHISPSRVKFVKRGNARPANNEVGHDEANRERYLRNLVSACLNDALHFASKGKWVLRSYYHLPAPFQSLEKGSYVICSNEWLNPQKAQEAVAGEGEAAREDSPRAVSGASAAGAPPTASPARPSGPQGAEEEAVKQWFREHAPLRIGCASWPEMLYFREKYLTGRRSTPEGVYAPILQCLLEAASALCGFQIEPDFKPLHADDLIGEMAKGPSERDIDLAACVVETPRRRKVADFTGQLHLVNLVGLTRKKEPRLQNIRELACVWSHVSEFKYGVITGEAGEEFLLDVLHVPPETLQESSELGSNGIKLIPLLGWQQADVVVTNAVAYASSLKLASKGLRKKTLHKFHVRFPTLAVYPVGFMIPMGAEPLRHWLNREVHRAAASSAFLDAQKDLFKMLRTYGLQEMLQAFHPSPLKRAGEGKEEK
jgi:hypothetical protein